MSERLVHTLRVRYAECDLQGVAYNAHYLTYFDTSMTELWRAAFGGYQAMLDRGVDMVLVQTSLRFLAAAHFDDELELAVVVTHLGNTSFRTQHSARCAGHLVAEAELTHVLVERRSAVKTPLPDWMRDGLAPWTAAEGRGPDQPGPTSV